MNQVKTKPDDLKKIIKQNFPVFSNEDLIEEMAANARMFFHSNEAEIVQPGDFPNWIPMVTKGAIKVSRVDAEGNEIFMYYLYAGQACSITLNCCLLDKPSSLKAVAEAGTEYVALPRLMLKGWINKYNDWIVFTLQSYDDRYQNLLSAVDAIAFRKLDQRLADLLRDKAIALGSNELEITHKKLADELNSSREVISRLLKQLEIEGKLKLGRNKVKLLQSL